MGLATAGILCDDDYILIENEYFKDDDINFIDPEIMEWVKSGWNKPRKIKLPKFNLNKKHNLNIRNNLPRKFKLCQP